MNTMLSKALCEFTTGPLNQLIMNLGGQDGDHWEQQFKRFLRKEPCWTNGKVAQAPTPNTRTNLLEFVSTVVIPATTGKFYASKKLVLNTKSIASVKISCLGDNFVEWFLKGDGKIEDPINEQVLNYAKLLKASVDGPIIKELGGEAKAETTLSDMFSLMEKQKHGVAGVLLNTRYANIFYVKDIAGVLRAVYVSWNGDGWYVDAYSALFPYRWDDGFQVFSRNFVL